MSIPGIVLIATGVVYLVKPDIFKRWIWTKTSIAQRALSPKSYQIYMRWLGVICIVVGLVFAFRGR